MGMDMVTKGVHNVIEFLSDDSPDMDVIGIFVEFLLDMTVIRREIGNKTLKTSVSGLVPSSEGDVGLAASSGPFVLGDKVDEECAPADPPEI
uniref:Uncharacterized protein n=1 Tax=Brassica oleracea var. oleracea TaxID=109376 RepID=A0A0D3BX05_BRAOL